MAFRHVAWGVLLLICSGGCGRLERARQCRELAARVNPGLAEIRQLSEGPQPPKTLRDIGARYDRIADELGPLEFQSRSLAQAVKEYGRQLRAVAAEARKAADAIEAKRPPTHQTARREVRLRSGQLRGIQHRIEESCR